MKAAHLTGGRFIARIGTGPRIHNLLFLTNLSKDVSLLTADGLTEQLDAKLQISEEAEAVPEQAAVPAEDLTPLQQLLKLCDQEVRSVPNR